MGNETPIDVEESQKFDIPEVKSSIQAVTLIWQGMSFLLSNYKKTTLTVIVVTVVFLSQFFTNFEQVKSLVGLFG
jgi:hypothetical protein